MAESIEKLKLYKTAWSDMYDCYVGIDCVYPDVDGVPIIKARLANDPFKKLIMFRVGELSNFVL